MPITPDRNDPCPCGSGRKYKQCCGAASVAGRASPSLSANPAARTRMLDAAVAGFGQSLGSELVGAFGASQWGTPAIGQPKPAASAAVRSAREKLELGNRLFAQGRFEDAIGAFQASLRLDANNPLTHNDLGAASLEIGRLAEAVVGFSRALALKPDLALAAHNLAMALNRQGDVWNAIDAYRRAVALPGRAPQAAAAHLRLGELLMSVGHYKDSIPHFQRAATLEPKTRLGRIAAVRALLVEERFAEAEKLLRRAIVLDPEDGLAHMTLGGVVAASGRFEEAEAHCRRAAGIDPHLVDAYNAIASCRRMTEADRPLIGRMLSLLQDPRTTDLERLTLNFVLGKALDDLRDPAGAMRHFDAAHALAHSHLRFDRDARERLTDNLIARFPAEIFAAHAPPGADDDRPLFIVGMPRSGTTLVEQILSRHPAVAAGGESRFWQERGPACRELGAGGLDPASLQAIADAYRAVMQEISPSAARVTDKNPFDFLWVGLIHRVFPRARIVHCRRNPVDTCLSIYTTFFAERLDFLHDRGDLVFFYRQYERLMAHWRAVLPAECFHEIDYEALTADPEGITRALVAFCGLDWNDACLRPEDNRRSVVTASAWQVRQPLYRTSVERWRRYEPWLGELRDLLAPGA